jgi:hypothetical protein
MKPLTAICTLLLVAAPALGFAQDKAYPDFDAIAKTTGPAPEKTRPPPPSAQSLAAWRAALSRAPLPKTGCFKSSYPGAEWREVPCTTAPPHPFAPASGPRPAIVGSGTYSPQVSGSISSVVGYLTVSGATSENDSGNANVFSLQINTNNNFTTSSCSNLSPKSAKPSACTGWQSVRVVQL